MNSFASARAKLMTLTVQCPVGGNPEGCPLSSRRKRSFSERFEWVQALSDEELRNIHQSHASCHRLMQYERHCLEKSQREGPGLNRFDR